jgi:hypothetical protein
MFDKNRVGKSCETISNSKLGCDYIGLKLSHIPRIIFFLQMLQNSFS